MNKPTAKERFRYWFDNVMARGTIALMGLLGVASLVFVAFVALVVVLVGVRQPGDDEPDFLEVIWGNLMRTLDAGTMADDAGWEFRTAMLVVTIGGLVIVASLIGIISSAFDLKVEELRKGHSRVLETDHTLILGWNSKMFSIVSELCIANESRRRASIVVLADRDKVEMEDELRAMIPNSRGTRIICRSGTPMNLTDLEISNPHTARSIIILAPEEAADADAVVIKTALALTNNPGRKPGQYHIVGEIQEPANLEAARLVGTDEAHWILASDLISRITVQSCRQSGLSVVYTELLDFGGDEIYFTDQPGLSGKSFFEAQLSFVDCTAIGIARGRSVVLNPAADSLLEPGDQVIVIAEDDSAIRLAAAGTPDPSVISSAVEPPATPERTLVLGYSSGVPVILEELNQYVAPGSSATLVADIDAPEVSSYSNLSVRFERGSTTSRALLDSLGVDDYDHIIVLAYKDAMDAQRADARTLVTLLHLRDIADTAGIHLNVVSEMLDDANRELAEVTKADDFIVSDKLVSLMLSQVSENKQLTDVFDLLFASTGGEIYLRPASLYVREGEEADFYTVAEAARRRGETAIGFRRAEFARYSDRGYGIRVNPNKRERHRFAEDDRVIVLANV